MISIFRGPTASLVPYSLNTYKNQNSLILKGSYEFARPFWIFRSIISILHNRVNEIDIERLLLSKKAYTSILFEKLNPYLDHADEVLKQLCIARLDSNYTHSQVAKSPMLEAFSEIIIELNKIYKFQIIIPDVNFMDVNSLDLLKHIYHKYFNTAPDLVIGYCNDWGDDQRDLQNGINWYYGNDTVTVLKTFVYAFENLAVTVEEIDSNLPRIEPFQNHEKDIVMLEKYDADIEWSTFQILNGDKINDADIETLLYGIVKCFQMYDFTNALLLGTKAMLKVEARISKAKKAQLLHSIGLCAHNRHFFTQGNAPLANYLYHVFSEALKYEADKSIRIALCYRLIVTVSRRKNDLDGADVYVQKAYAELEAYSGENKSILLAWVLNVHSYMLMKRKDLNGAIQKHETAYYLLAEHFFPPNLVALDEVNFTKAILAENLATLNAQADNFEKVQIWYAIETTLTNLWPSLIVVSSAEWQSFYYQQLKLSLALAHSIQGIERCRESFNYILEYFFTLSVAEIQNKMGNALEAIEFYKRCLIFHDRIGNSYSQISFFELNMTLIKVSVYAGNYLQAIDLIQNLERSKTDVSHIEHIAICEQYAMAYAYHGSAEDAEKHVNLAIDIAVTEGDCNLMFKSILVAAKVCQILNRAEDAITAYFQALEVSKTIVDGQSFVASNTDLMFLHLGLLESGDAMDKDFYNSLLCSLAKALKEDSESWWNLSRFLKHLYHLPTIESDLIKQFNPAAYSKILGAGFERSDCKTYLEFNKNELQINLN